jgi:hypothetical protein
MLAQGGGERATNLSRTQVAGAREAGAPAAGAPANPAEKEDSDERGGIERERWDWKVGREAGASVLIRRRRAGGRSTCAAAGAAAAECEFPSGDGTRASEQRIGSDVEPTVDIRPPLVLFGPFGPGPRYSDRMSSSSRLTRQAPWRGRRAVLEERKSGEEGRRRRRTGQGEWDGWGLGGSEDQRLEGMRRRPARRRRRRRGQWRWERPCPLLFEGVSRGTSRHTQDPSVSTWIKK